MGFAKNLHYSHLYQESVCDYTSITAGHVDNASARKAKVGVRSLGKKMIFVVTMLGARHCGYKTRFGRLGVTTLTVRYPCQTDAWHG